MIEICESKRAPIFQEVQPDHARDIGKRSVAIVHVENIPLIPAPATIGADQLINRAPSLFVVVRRLSLFRRIGDHLPPEKTVQVFIVVFARGTADHAIADIEIGKTVMIKIPGVARPRPAPDPDAGRARCILESESTSAISRSMSKERIAHGVLVIERSRLPSRIFLENVLRRNAFARRRPHVRHVEDVHAIIVVVKPADAHPRANIFKPRLPSNIGKNSVAIVAVKSLPSQTLHSVKIGPAISLEVVLAATKAVARVVLFEPSLGGWHPQSSIPR